MKKIELSLITIIDIDIIVGTKSTQNAVAYYTNS